MAREMRRGVGKERVNERDNVKYDSLCLLSGIGMHIVG